MAAKRPQPPPLPEPRRPVSDAEYLRRYEQEVRAYVERYDVRRPRAEAGKEHLRALRWAWVDDGGREALRWERYAAMHPALKVLRADGIWCPRNQCPVPSGAQRSMRS